MYTADFETTTTPDDCRVWAWGLFEIGSYDNFICGNSIESFMVQLEALAAERETIYFHNLKFDSEFLMYELFRRGFEHIKDKKDKHDASFTTLISDKGQFYAMEIYFKVGKKGKHKRVKILDSLKVLPFSVDQTAKAFGLELKKLNIDYDAPRPRGHILTNNEIEYLKNDCKIVARALEYLFEDGLTKMTTAANAINDYKNTIGLRAFERLFPDPSYYDSDVRQSYKGGFTYANPKYQEQDVGGGIVLDVNSLYPSVMYNCFLPYGEPKFFMGKYKPDSLFDVYIQMISCNFELKPDHIPTIQIKGSSIFHETEYLTSSAGEDVVMILTNVDLELFLDHYNVYNLEYISGWMWKSSNTMFRDYIDKWNAVKMQASIDGNAGKRTLAKLQLNSLYGRFGINPKTRSKYPYLNDEGGISYKTGDVEERKPLYIPVASFVTSYARNITIRAAQQCYNRFLYADTDSLHLLGYELPKNLDVDPVKLGAWKHESSFVRARYLRSKTYVEEESIISRSGYQIDYKRALKVTCAGMPAKIHDKVTFDNFRVGSVYWGKLYQRHVDGGIVLEEGDFTIKARNI